MQLDGTDVQKQSLEEIQKELSQSLEQCKTVTDERDLLKDELAELKSAAEAVVAMVDPIEEGSTAERPLVDRLHEAPQKITSFLSDTSRQYLAHALGLVMSFWPAANLTLIGNGLADGCSEEKFVEYVEEVIPINDKIISGLV